MSEKEFDGGFDHLEEAKGTILRLIRDTAGRGGFENFSVIEVLETIEVSLSCIAGFLAQADALEREGVDVGKRFGEMGSRILVSLSDPAILRQIHAAIELLQGKEPVGGNS